MIRLAGKSPGTDVEIVYTGLRPGEKLFEELFHPAETLVQTPHEKLLLARSRETDWKTFEAAMGELEKGCAEYDEAGIRQVLGDLLPEYQPPAIESLSENVIAFDKAKK